MIDSATAFIVFALSQLVITIALVAPAARREVRARILLLFLGAALLTVGAPVLLDSGGVDWLRVPAQVARLAVPTLFWLTCVSLFDDRFRFRLFHGGLLAFVAGLPILYFLALSFLAATPGPPMLVLVLVDGPQIAEYALLVWALVSLVRQWREDLVAGRRILRGLFLGAAGLYIAAVIIFEQFLGARGVEREAVFAAALALSALSMNMLLLRLRRQVLFPAPDAPALAPANGSGDADAAALKKLMEEDAVYREEDLTIGRLALRLQLPEYRLRRLINEGLGYRNFNDFLNRYRISEAAAVLGDDARAETSILTIALDSGFRSLSVFNRAFRDHYGVTPTAYRKSCLSR